MKWYSRVALSAACLALPTIASAQGWAPGAEIAGHGVQIETNGVMNTVYFDQNGGARIVTPSGREVPARWFVENQGICLETAASVRECWQYRAPFQSGQAVTLTSSCQSTSRWTALSTNPMAPPPASSRLGERG